jgi:hypothetical protein
MGGSGIIFKGAIWLLALIALAMGPGTANGASKEPDSAEENEFFVTTDDDIAFVERFQQAIREDDRQWIVERTRVGFGLLTNGQDRTFKSKRELLRRFDEIYTPEVRAAILATPLRHLRKSWRNLLFLRASEDSPLITIAILCAPPPVNCRETAYAINSVTR